MVPADVSDVTATSQTRYFKYSDSTIANDISEADLILLKVKHDIMQTITGEPSTSSYSSTVDVVDKPIENRKAKRARLAKERHNGSKHNKNSRRRF